MGPGLVLAGLCVVLLVLNFAVPWLHPQGGGDAIMRWDVDDEPALGAYTDRLVTWPLVALIMGSVLALGVALLPLAALRPGGHRALMFAALGACAFCGFMVALTGFRWLGAYIVSALSEDGFRNHLGAAPYLNLAGGLAIVGACGWHLWGPVSDFLASPPRGLLPPVALRIASLAVLVAAGVLLLLPLLPYAHVDAVGTGTGANLDEQMFEGERDLATLDDAADQLGAINLFLPPGDEVDLEPLYRVASDFEWTYAMVWATLYVGIFTLSVTLADRTGFAAPLWAHAAQAFSLLAVASIVGLVFAALLYVHLPQADIHWRLSGPGGTAAFTLDTTLAVNFLPLPFFAATGWLVWWHARAVALPHWRAVRVSAAPAVPTPPVRPVAPKP